MANTSGRVVEYRFLVAILSLVISVSTSGNVRSDNLQIPEGTFSPGGALTICTTPRPLQPSDTPISCPTNSSIYLTQVLYGWTRNTMTYGSPRPCRNDQATDVCVEDGTEYLAHCMNVETCRIPRNSHFLDLCGKNSTYLYVKYVCINAYIDVYNMCEETSNCTLNSTLQGFLLSPLYPQPYPLFTQCSCQLTAEDATVVIHVVDFQMEERHSNSCIWDWLDIANEAKGIEHRVCDNIMHNTTWSAPETISLEFMSDYSVNHRGFWLYFYGITNSNERVPVSISCSDNKTLKFFPEDPDLTGVYETSSLPQYVTSLEPSTTINFHFATTKPTHQGSNLVMIVSGASGAAAVLALAATAVVAALLCRSRAMPRVNPPSQGCEDPVASTMTAPPLGQYTTLTHHSITMQMDSRPSDYVTAQRASPSGSGIYEEIPKDYVNKGYIDSPRAPNRGPLPTTPIGEEVALEERNTSESGNPLPQTENVYLDLTR